MIILLSPAKALDFETPAHIKDHSQPQFVEESEKLIKKLRTLSRKKIGDLMKISAQLSDLNYDRYHSWEPNFQPGDSKQAILSFNGEVYRGFDASSLKSADFKFAQKHVRILSGLHGLLKPLDLIRPYRLEMGTRLPVGRAKNLYAFWDEKIAEAVNESAKASKSKYILNLASNEYFKSVKQSALQLPVINAHFKENKNGVYKALMAYAKLARGFMTRFIVDNRLTNIEEIKTFDREGYIFNDSLSTETDWVFTRG